MLALGNENFRAGEHEAEATRETEHRSAMHSAASTEVQYTLLVQQNSDFTNARALVFQCLERPIKYAVGREFDSRQGHEVRKKCQ